MEGFRRCEHGCTTKCGGRATSGEQQQSAKIPLALVSLAVAVVAEEACCAALRVLDAAVPPVIDALQDSKDKGTGQARPKARVSW